MLAITNIAERSDFYVMHLLAVLVVTLVCIGSIVLLALNGTTVPESINYIATGGGAYLIGNVVANNTKTPSDKE